MKQTLVFSLIVSCSIMLTAIAQSAERSSKKTGTGPSFKGPVGLQLYSLRDSFSKDVPGTLAKVRDLGFKYVELAGTYNMQPDQFKRTLKEYGLTAISAHFPYERWRDDLDGVVREAKALGLNYAGIPWIPHDGAFTEKTCREAAALFNKAGEAMAANGMKFFYHQHGYEFEKFQDGTLMDLLMKETNPKTVSYQMDIFWIVFPGQDPVQLLDKYGKRWELMHLKDMRKGTKTGDLTGHTDVRNDAAIGAGQMDIPAILKAAKKAKVKWYFIEDESPSVEQQLPESLRYLETVKF